MQRRGWAFNNPARPMRGQGPGGSESPFLFYTHFSAIVREEGKSDGELLECRVA